MDLDDDKLKATRRINGSDKNVGSIEEDIKRLKVLLIHAENTLLDEEAIAIEHLIEAYKELEEKWDKDTHTLQNALDLANADKINNYIPVSLVEETIEELNKQFEEDLQDERKVNSNRFIIICQCKNCLQELLEKRE